MIIKQAAVVLMNRAAVRDIAVNASSTIGVWVSYLAAYSHLKWSEHMTGQWKGLSHVKASS